MRVLLFGEYSGFFNSLKEGLMALDHKVVLTGGQDSFKKYPVDISLAPSFFEKKWPRYFRIGIYKLVKRDIAVLEMYLKFQRNKIHFKNFDIVFLINEQPLTQTYFFDKKILKFLFKNNTKVFLSACGDDVITINYYLENKRAYHPLTPFLNKKVSKKHFKYALRYKSKKALKLHHFVFKNINHVIPADLDYLLAYRQHPKALPMLPFPVRVNKLSYLKPKLDDKITIFHGINRANYFKKGNDIFEKALEIIQQKYATNINIIIAENLPYEIYIKKYDSAQIFLDQVYSVDQGYNALEAMAKGKVVFTGAEQEWLDYYNLNEDTVAINALPDAEKIAKKLQWLILNPEKIIEISKNARKFVENKHDYKRIAQNYVEVWNSYDNTKNQ